jgi:uncharacterized protein YciI
MKRLLLPLLLILTFNAAISQTSEIKYDAALAKELGADERGMKMYIMVILKTGPANITDKAVRDSLFAGHFSNMTAMSEKGKLIVAGPFDKNDKGYRGIFILDVPTVEEAKALIQNDPTVKEKIFEADLVPWYGSAALVKFLDFHKKIEKK